MSIVDKTGDFLLTIPLFRGSLTHAFRFHVLCHDKDVFVIVALVDCPIMITGMFACHCSKIKLSRQVLDVVQLAKPESLT